MIKEYNGKYGTCMFDTDEFEICGETDKYLHYVGKGGLVKQPIGYNSLHAMFIYCDVRALDLADWDVSKVSDFSEAFSYCSSLKNIKGIEHWKTSAGVNFALMFNNCKSLTTLNLNRWDMSNAADISGMFFDCINLTELNVASWNIANCKDISCFVNGCESLVSLDVTKWDTQNVTYAEKFACSCHNLQICDVSGWDNKFLVTFEGMFANCDKLKKPDLSGWNYSDFAISKIFNEAGISGGVSTLNLF